MITVISRLKLSSEDLAVIDAVAAQSNQTRDQFVSNYLGEVAQIERDVRAEGYGGLPR